MHRCPIPLKAAEPVMVKKNMVTTIAHSRSLEQKVFISMASVLVIKPTTKYGKGMNAGTEGPKIDNACLGNKAPKLVKLKNEATS